MRAAIHSSAAVTSSWTVSFCSGTICDSTAALANRIIEISLPEENVVMQMRSTMRHKLLHMSAGSIEPSSDLLFDFVAKFPLCHFPPQKAKTNRDGESMLNKRRSFASKSMDTHLRCKLPAIGCIPKVHEQCAPTPLGVQWRLYNCKNH